MEGGTLTKKFGAAQNLRYINRRARCSYSLAGTKINTRGTRRGKKWHKNKISMVQSKGMDEDKNVLQFMKIKAKLTACPHGFLLERHNKIRYHEKLNG